MATPATLPLDAAGMQARKTAYYAFVRSQRLVYFNPDGTYAPGTENDRRITYWLFPALVASADPAERDWALRFYAADPCWADWNIFTTSSIAITLARERERLTPELVRRSEEHLAKFTIVDNGRKPCSAANDYVFHGYNDNMPAMAVRTMLLAGEILGRADCTDRGMFHLEGLCAHFQRRGLLSEHTSATYTPITLTALMDVAECCANPEAREMALACANRILLDVFGHFHPGTGTLGGAQSRAYTVDCTATLSIYNGLMWYLTGHPLLVNPMEALTDEQFPGPIHHGRCRAFSAANITEVFSPAYTAISQGVREFAQAKRPRAYEIRATTDSGQSGLLGGVKEIVTRAWHRPQWCLGTASKTWFDASGHQLVTHGAIAAVPKPRSWRDRLTFWHRLQEGPLDQGDLEKNSCDGMTETDLVRDWGHYHTVQKQGSAMVLGIVGPGLLAKEITQLKLSLLFGTFNRMPDEMFENDTPLAAWDGEAAPQAWQFLRFGEVYVGIRASGMVNGVAKAARRVLKNKYLRVELPLVDGEKVTVTQEFRDAADFGYILELADQAECGDFATFRSQCRRGAWEFYHAFYRTSRFCGRNGELQIIDSPAAGTARFFAVDGEVEQPVFLAATGLEPRLTRLFKDGHRVRQRRIMYSPEFIGSPFYAGRLHVIACDDPAAAT